MSRDPDIDALGCEALTILRGLTGEIGIYRHGRLLFCLGALLGYVDKMEREHDLMASHARATRGLAMLIETALDSEQVTDHQSDVIAACLELLKR